MCQGHTLQVVRLTEQKYMWITTFVFPKTTHEQAYLSHKLTGKRITCSHARCCTGKIWLFTCLLFLFAGKTFVCDWKGSGLGSSFYIFKYVHICHSLDLKSQHLTLPVNAISKLEWQGFYMRKKFNHFSKLYKIPVLALWYQVLGLKFQPSWAYPSVFHEVSTLHICLWVS